MIFFDIETIPDYIIWERKEEKEFPPIYAHKIICISYLRCDKDFTKPIINTIFEKDKEDIIIGKFLYEYFKDELSEQEDLNYTYLPSDFKRLQYQEQAVLNAKKILETYGGVFISDVVGLGKTYITAMLVNQIDGRTLVIAPPVLLEENNPGSWPNVFDDFRIHAHFESVGKLDDLKNTDTNKYKNVVIDEAHRFRNESTVTYENLAQICRGKRVILVTATPYNNSPKDILSQIKLFQKGKKSTIPNIPDLEGYFNSLEKNLSGLDRKNDFIKYNNIIKENAKEIREKVLKYLIVRRTRTEIIKYFRNDLAEQKLSFPEVADPVQIFYKFNKEEDYVFNRTIELIAQNFLYSRYTPMLYYRGLISQPEEISQKNMGKFMKILLIKRLESSFFAFRNTLKRFIHSYEQFISEFKKGNVYVSKKYTNKIFELLENDDDEAVERLIAEDKAIKHSSSDFSDDFQKHLEGDLSILKEIDKLWQTINRDPKLETLLSSLEINRILKNKKIIIFTESKETANYLSENIRNSLCFTGSSFGSVREKVINNFDAKARAPKDDYRILISTEVLSEGVNLHQSNIVINYDIPWNPTRMMQRVGRINRVDTKFDKIYTFNFFPTEQSDDQIKLKQTAQAKINAFFNLLGADAPLLTDGESIQSFELFDRLSSKRTITGEDESEESELKYLQIIRDLRDNEPDTFNKIKSLPKKARTASMIDIKKGITSSCLLTYFRRGKLQKFFISEKNRPANELDFMTAAKMIEVKDKTRRQILNKDFYELLDKNKAAFIDSTAEEQIQQKSQSGRDSAKNILKIIKAVMKDTRQFTDEQETFVKKIITQLEEGGLPKQTTKRTLKKLQEELQRDINPLKILGILQTHITHKLLESHFTENNNSTKGKREVILSEYFTGRS